VRTSALCVYFMNFVQRTRNSRLFLHPSQGARFSSHIFLIVKIVFMKKSLESVRSNSFLSN
jgi:hypothetical protein